MKHLFRSLLLLVPLVVGLSAVAPPGRAQTARTSRFAFADTTLLRDTLGLHFENLYPVADSLGMTADTLRALSIRYRYPIERLLVLSDSLGAPVDSVGVILLRERFNPLAAGSHQATVFTYNSNYGLAQTSHDWANGTLFTYAVNRFLLNNTTNVRISSFTGGTTESSLQERTSLTTLDYRVSPRLSVGGLASLSRTNDDSQGELLLNQTTNDNYQFSLRSKQQARQGITSEFNFLSGLIDIADLSKEKRGLSADVNGRLRVVRGGWFTHDAVGRIATNVSNTRPLTIPNSIQTSDLSENFQGTMGLWSSRPISMNANYLFRNSKVENPVASKTASGADSTYIQDVLTGNNSVDVSLRLRRDSERFVNLTQRFGRSRQASASNVSQLNTRKDRGFNAVGRYAYRAFSLDGTFGVGVVGSEFPRRSATGGYAEDAFMRNIDATLAWQASRQLVLRVNGGVTLSSYRYSVIGSFPTPPVPRDLYQQFYRASAIYNPTSKFGTDLALNVSRTQFINIPAASTAANNEVNGYRGTWNWTYRALTGLTITQRNTLGADYTNAQLTGNDRLALDYGSVTTLNVVISRLQLDVTHTSRYQPSGGYVQDQDGTYFLATADETQTYSLSASATYNVTSGISFYVRPGFTDSERQNSVDGELVPQRLNRNLTFSSGASLNIPVGRKATLSGNISRTYNGSRSATYVSGVPSETPRVESDFWNGALSFSWSL